MMLKVVVFVSVLAALAFPASAQILVGPAQFTPPSPTGADPIRARFTVQVPGPCVDESSTVVVGTVVRTTTTLNCGVLQAFDIEIVQDFGPLAPNTYTYEIYFAVNGDPPALQSTQTLAVSDAAAVPALSPLGTVLLTVVLGAAATVMAGRALSP